MIFLFKEVLYWYLTLLPNLFVFSVLYIFIAFNLVNLTVIEISLHYRCGLTCSIILSIPCLVFYSLK